MPRRFRTRFPTTPGAHDRSYSCGANDVFVAKLAPALPGAAGLQYATFLGGEGLESEEGIALIASVAWGRNRRRAARR